MWLTVMRSTRPWRARSRISPEEVAFVRRGHERPRGCAQEESPYHDTCRERLEVWRKGSDAWFLTWGIVYEFLRVATHPRVARRPWSSSRAWEFVRLLLDSPGLQVLQETERHAAVAALVTAELPHLTGNILHDAHTAILMREHGIRTIYTRDTGFHRFPFLEVIDPAATRLVETAARYRTGRSGRRAKTRESRSTARS